jgi:hypothetical protein
MRSVDRDTKRPIVLSYRQGAADRKCDPHRTVRKTRVLLQSGRWPLQGKTQRKEALERAMTSDGQVHRERCATTKTFAEDIDGAVM